MRQLKPAAPWKPQAGMQKQHSTDFYQPKTSHSETSCRARSCAGSFRRSAWSRQEREATKLWNVPYGTPYTQWRQWSRAELRTAALLFGQWTSWERVGEQRWTLGEGLVGVAVAETAQVAHCFSLCTGNAHTLSAELTVTGSRYHSISSLLDMKAAVLLSWARSGLRGCRHY